MNILIALVPVLLFLGALFLMDSFKLVRMRSVAAAMVRGGAAALAALWLQDSQALTLVPPDIDNRYIAPIVEETIKALLIVPLIRGHGVAFLVDAAVLGFATGSGFSLIENVVYLNSLDAPLSVWLVRGLGTAILHGATTAIFAMISRTLADRHPDHRATVFLPGLAGAIVLHSVFNHLLVSPAAQTVLILIVLPLLVVWVFERSERATREWIGAGLDLDIAVLELLSSEQFSGTRFGRYLQQLRSRFSGLIVADMFCLLRLELELSVQAKAMLLARQAGVGIAADEDLEDALAERRYLQHSIGRTGLLALKPLQVTSGRDRWHRHLLRDTRPRGRARIL